MSIYTSLRGFWTSSEVERIVAQAMTDLDSSSKKPAHLEPWEVLASAIIRENTRGTYRIPPPMIASCGYLLDEVPFFKDDGSATYVRFRCLLGTAADILSRFRHRVREVFGNDAWQVASACFEEPQGQTLFHFLCEISATTRPKAVECLEKVSRQGLRVEWPGGLRSRIRSRDCGIEHLVGIARSIVSCLESRKDAAELAGQTRMSSNERKRVIVDSVGPNLVRLRFENVVVELNGMARQLFLLLFWSEQSIVTFEQLWTAIYTKKSGQLYRPDRKGGPPDKLRSLKCRLNSEIRRRFGKPSGRQFWIEDVKGEGYRLNKSSVTWQRARGNDDRPPFATLDPRQLDALSHRSGVSLA